MKIAIFGSNLYAGVMAVLFTECGHEVWVCNEQADPFAELKEQEVIHALEQQLHSGFLHYCPFRYLPEVLDSYIFSFNPADEEYALKLAYQLSEQTLIHPKLMVNASTFGLNGTEKLKKYLPEDHWVYFPDVIQEGRAFRSITRAAQIVIGCDEHCEQAQVLIKEMLRPFFPRPQQYLFMPTLDAEFTKLSISGLLAARISYVNDLAVVAEKIGVDIEHVRQGMAADSRIGNSYLYPGAGFGGENFCHDILTLSSTISNTGAKSQLLQQVWEINEQQKEFLFRKLWNYFHSDLSEKVVTIWGASFKENTSSIRFSPIHPMLAALWAQGVTVRLHDPKALPEIEKYYGQRDDLILCEDQYGAAEGAHALCLLTSWRQYWTLDYATLKEKMNHPLILDGRNIYQPEYVKSQGFAYMGVGR